MGVVPVRAHAPRWMVSVFYLAILRDGCLCGSGTHPWIAARRL